MDAAVMLVVSALVPFILERSKDWAWFPLMQRVHRFAPLVNRVTPLAISFLAAVGVTISFDASTGVLSIAGLVPEQVIRAGVLAVVGMVTNQASYHGLVKPKAAP